MINLEQFIQKWKGKRNDYDKAYGYQCVDLIKQYTLEVFNIHLGSFGGSAKTGWKNSFKTFTSNIWEKIPNNPKDPNQVPQTGDIIFWNKGRYGHVAIVVQGYKGSNKIKILEQNGGQGNGSGLGDDAIRVTYASYGYISGWYRKKEDFKALYFEEKGKREVLEESLRIIFEETKKRILKE